MYDAFMKHQNTNIQKKERRYMSTSRDEIEYNASLLPNDRRGFLFSCSDVGGMRWQDDWFWRLTDDGYRYSEIGFEAFQTIDFNRAASDDPRQFFVLGLRFKDETGEVKARWDNIVFDVRLADIVKFQSNKWPFAWLKCQARLICPYPSTLIVELKFESEKQSNLDVEVWLKPISDRDIKVEAKNGLLCGKCEGKSLVVCGRNFGIKDKMLMSSFNLEKGNNKPMLLSMSAAETVDPGVDALKALEISLDETEDQIMSYYRNIPKVDTGNREWDRLFYKVFDDKRLNTLKIPRENGPLFECPDRPRHNSLWLWDSCFHSFVWKLYNYKGMATAPLVYLLRLQDERTGFVPITFGYEGIESSQPPLLSWTLSKVTDDVHLLTDCYSKLVKLHKWWEANRRIEGTPFCGWKDGGESGMDNSPRWDGGVINKGLAAVDLNSQLCLDAFSLSRIASNIGLKDDATKWIDEYNEMSEGIRRHFWDEKDRFFYDRFKNGEFHRIKTISSFWTMVAGVASKDQAESMLKHLLNPKEFNTPYPFPTISISEKLFMPDYVRGAVWMMMNYIVILGLENYQYRTKAKDFTARMVAMVSKDYMRTGYVWECYDPFTGTGEYVEKKGRGPRTIAEYFCGWTGLVADLMLRYDFTDLRWRLEC